MLVDNRLENLRNQMKSNHIDAWIVPSSDPHQSEYVAEHWKERNWISGFSGSAGTALITQDHAGLWTDSRYFLQAEQELETSSFELHRLSNDPQSSLHAWLIENLPPGSIVGCNGSLFSVAAIENLDKALKAASITLATHLDLVSSLWTDRPPLPVNPVFEHPLELAGQSRAEKFKAIRKEMLVVHADFHLITTLDDIAWTFNLRGSDVACNPVFIAYSIISHEQVHLFIDDSKLTPSLQESLERDGVLLHEYATIQGFLNNLTKEHSVLIDPDTTNFFLYSQIKQPAVLRGQTIPLKLKAVKNPAEIEGIKKAMVKDGIALTEFFVWLEKELPKGNLNEFMVGKKLAYFRSKRGNYHGESFFPIVGYNGNGAIVHYRAPEESSAQIKNEGVLLIDSGGQYSEGTTDITRTIGLGKNTPEQKQNYTLVLKGHIALSRAVFPMHTKGAQLDTLARQFLWQHHLDYGHGTGHGVGAFLNVHEPPQGFAPNLSMRGTTGFVPGMFTSNEPGFYKTDAYGIRIENLVLSVQTSTDDSDTPFLAFQELTLFPIDKNLIDKNLLTKEEISWLDQYHQKVYEIISPHLEAEHKLWLQQRCEPLAVQP